MELIKARDRQTVRPASQSSSVQLLAYHVGHFVFVLSDETFSCFPLTVSPSDADTVRKITAFASVCSTRSRLSGTRLDGNSVLMKYCPKNGFGPNRNWGVEPCQ